MDKITTKSTSIYSADIVEPIVLEETPTTRKVFYATINDFKLQTHETVSGTIIHQRKGRNNEWENIKSINLNSLKGGEGVKLHLNSSQTRKLFDGLIKLYKISEKGINFGETEFVVGLANELIRVPKERRKFIKHLLDKEYGEEIWNELIDSSPDLATRLSLSRLQSERTKALNEFEKNIDTDKDESYWQKFFSKNQWIFGYGLKYCFLTQLTDQPNYGGANYKGKGNQRGDFLLNSASEIKFTVLVEIKTPKTPLLAIINGKHKQYRNGAWQLSSSLTGGVSQIQINCKTWWKNSFETVNYEELRKKNIFTVNPKGILVIGKSKELNELSKAETFESFRRNLENPEIVTFDELFQRAKYIVEKDKEEIEEQDYPF